MFRLKVKKLIEEYGIKQEYLIELINSNRNTFPKKLTGQIEFTPKEKSKIKSKYGVLM